MIKKPELSPRALVARDAVVCGDVHIGAETGVWFHTTIRAEPAPITIGCRTNIQDNCVLHTDAGLPMTVGDRVTVGHSVILHSCTVGDNALIGMGSVVLNGAKIGKNCYIGAGSLVTQNTVIPDGSMAFGRPARVVRPVTDEELRAVREGVLAYLEEAEEYREMGLFRSGAEME